MIKVPVQDVHELELSSICNLACVYCPHPKLQREKAHMSWKVFERALEHVEYYVKRGTQTELSVTGIGEAILHPRFAEALWLCREVLGPDRLLVVSTNGVAVDDDIIRAFVTAKARVYVSLHRPEIATPAARRISAAGVETYANHAFVDSAIDWAGQVEWHSTAQRYVCDYLRRRWAVIRQDGSVNACCQDAHGLHALGSVWDEPGSWETHAIPLCANCHLIVPPSMREDRDVRVA